MADDRVNIAKAVAEIYGVALSLGVTFWLIWWLLGRLFALPPEVVTVLLVGTISIIVSGALMGFRIRWHQQYAGAAAETRIRPERRRPLLVQSVAGVLCALGAAYALWLGFHTGGAVLVLLTAILSALFASYGFFSLSPADRHDIPLTQGRGAERWLQRAVIWIPVGLLGAVAVVRIAVADLDTAVPVLFLVPLLAGVVWVARSVLWR